MNSQQFAYDFDNKIIYYISHQEKKYVAIDESQKEIYNFLLHVYVCQWKIIKDRIERDYVQVDRIQEICD
jgi:hypothetical protein